MVKVIMYSTDNIDYDVLKIYTYPQYNPIAIGSIHNKWWFVFGDFDFEVYKPERKVYKNEKAYEHLTKKAISSITLLTLCNHFGKHIVSENTDIEVEGVGKGRFIQNINSIINYVDENKLTEYSDHRIQLFKV